MAEKRCSKGQAAGGGRCCHSAGLHSVMQSSTAAARRAAPGRQLPRALSHTHRRMHWATVTEREAWGTHKEGQGLVQKP